MPEQYPEWADSLYIWREGPDRFVCQLDIDDDWHPASNGWLVIGWGPTPHDAIDDAIRRGNQQDIQPPSDWERE